MRTDDILVALNAYEGENIWQDVIGRLDVDEDATDAIDLGMNDRFVLATGETVKHHDNTGWTIT